LHAGEWDVSLDLSVAACGLEIGVNPMLPAPLQVDLVLASGSPRRAAILRMLGFEFEIVVDPIAEEELGSSEPIEHVQSLARLKAEAAARGRHRGVFLGADTIVVIDGEILNKPPDAAAALGMLQRLRGRWHTVFTGLALLDVASSRTRVEFERTEVRFADWDDAALRRYIATGECMDKAGAYAIQGLGALLVAEIRGDYYNVMGLPVGLLVRMLAELRAREVSGAG
jgi:septum formation protein